MSFTVRRLKETPARKKRSLPWKKALFAGVSIAGSIMGYRKLKLEQEEQDTHKRTALLKRIVVVLIAVLIALFFVAGTVKGMISMKIINVDTVVSVAGSAPAANENGHTNILLLGQGDAGHDGKDLTDTIMVASIDPTDTKSVVLLSLPRDMYFLSTEKMGKGKINSMYRDYKSYLWYQEGVDKEDAKIKALTELKDEIGRKLGIEIHYAVKVDFEGFVKAVDILEGIDLEVPYDIVDTEYPDENYGYQTFEISAGPHTLDGDTALKYARSRHTTSDFGRSARQQQLLKAMAEKAKQSGIASEPTKITSMIRVLSDHVDTTMTVSEMIGLADIARDLDKSRIITMQLNDRNALFDSFIEPGGFLYTPPRDLFEGHSVLLPVSIPEFPVTWKQIQTLTELIMHHRKLYIAEPQIAILNSSAPSGTARKLGYELIRYGFNVPTINNFSGEKQDISTISYADPSMEPLATFFALLLDLHIAPLPEDIDPENIAPLTIILGTEYRYSPFQDLVTL